MAEETAIEATHKDGRTIEDLSADDIAAACRGQNRPRRASPVGFASGEALTFVVRLTGEAPDKSQSDLRLMQLLVRDGKRYLTKTYIPLDVQSYRQLVYGLNPHARKLAALSFKLTPLARLAPGEYALGLDFSRGAFGDAYAFGIDAPAPSATAR